MVIDIHTHIFSGRDIPLQGYLSSRRYDEWYVRLLAPILFPLICDSIRNEGPSFLKPLEDIFIEIAIRYLGEGHRRWGEILSMHSTAEIARKMMETYEPDTVDLFVPLMIDFEYWFANSIDHPIKDQVESVYRDVVIPYRGKIHPFAPFDPARELAFRAGLPCPDGMRSGKPEACSSLELLKDAIRNKGFIGVKVYNTMGYRPLGNAEVDDERRSIFLRNGMKPYAAFSGEAFDEVMIELYEFCLQEQVPITAHCVSNGMEGYPGASLVFGGPRFWKPVLERYPGLHINLAHYGWSRPDAYRNPRHTRSFRRWRHKVGQWIRRRPRLTEPDDEMQDWTVKITKLMSAHPNLYTDVAHHGVVLPSYQPGMIASYQAICRDYPGLIAERLLYGTDWHVFTRIDNFQEFQKIYRKLLLENEILDGDGLENFLAGNAIRFLGLLPLGTAIENGWSKNRERLQQFYAREKIEAPEWFMRTA